jgi:hypothetical protein
LVDQTINEIEFLFPLSEELEDRLRVSALKRKGDIICYPGVKDFLEMVSYGVRKKEMGK